MNNAEIVEKLCKDFEPIGAVELNNLTAKGVEITAIISIAISLKRIADKLELSQKQPVIMNAEEYAKYQELKIKLPDGRIVESKG